MIHSRQLPSLPVFRALREPFAGPDRASRHRMGFAHPPKSRRHCVVPRYDQNLGVFSRIRKVPTQPDKRTQSGPRAQGCNGRKGAPNGGARARYLARRREEIPTKEAGAPRVRANWPWRLGVENNGNVGILRSPRRAIALRLDTSNATAALSIPAVPAARCAWAPTFLSSCPGKRPRIDRADLEFSMSGNDCGIQIARRNHKTETGM